MGQRTRGVVAAGHSLTAEAGAEILRQGGNAFDAAVAAVLTACVCESALTSLAGGGFLLAHTATGENTLFDFFTQTPGCKQLAHGQQLDFYPVAVNFGDTVQSFHIGLGAMAVPGTLAGLAYVHRRLGQLPLKAVAEPALHWARQGNPVEPFRAYVLQILAPILTATEAARELYAPAGQLLQAGDLLRMPAFADTLEELINSHIETFYQGAIAQQIAQDCASVGGYLTMEDLSGYRVIERSPLKIRYRNKTLLTNPPPSSGGTLIAFALKLLEQVNLHQFSHGNTGHLTWLTEAMRLTNLARRRGYDARLYEQEVADWFLSAQHLSEYQETLATTTNKWGSTTHISVIDEVGNAASVTSSNGEGSSYIIPGTQIMMNNMLGEEDLNPEGFHLWSPGQRMSSMMAPTILLEAGRPQLVLGSGGSNRIRTAILQVISNVLDFQMDIQQAVRQPRIHWERNILHLEPGYDRNALETGLDAGDEQVWWQQPNMFFGGVHVVAANQAGEIDGAGDPRRGGAVARS